MIEFRQQVNQERAVLIGIIDGKTRKREAQEHLDELAFLASTAGAHPAEQFQQRVNKPNPKTLVGQGKLEEISWPFSMMNSALLNLRISRTCWTARSWTGLT
jgi:50S ribosomal subunit-associated GTPase HflX